MPANRPSKEVRVQREAQAWELRCKGWTHDRIARRLGVTRRAVGLILDRVEARELKRLAASVERQKVTQTGQLEHVIDESMRAWRKSKEPRRRAVRKTGSGGDGADQAEATEQTEAVDQTGDPRHLQTAMNAMDRLRDLWGLNVLAAQQESTASVSAVTARMRERARRYEQSPVEGQPVDPSGPAAGPGTGTGPLPGRSVEVQRDDPGDGPAMAPAT